MKQHWRADLEKTNERRSALEAYYKECGLNACDFHCSHYERCFLSQKEGYIRQYSGGTAAIMPIYDLYYDDIPIRVMIVGKETGYMKNKEFGTSTDFQENISNVLNCINWEKKNNHIKGTLYLLQYLFYIKTEYIYASYTLSNLLRCAFQKSSVVDTVSAVHDTVTMRKNCVDHLINEIRILQPTILITQGEWAIKDKGAFLNALHTAFGHYTCLKKNNSGKYGLYQFENMICITTHHPAILGNWVKNYAPDSVYPMIDLLRKMDYIPIIDPDSMSEYENLVKPIVDPMLQQIPSNNLLRNNASNQSEQLTFEFTNIK